MNDFSVTLTTLVRCGLSGKCESILGNTDWQRVYITGKNHQILPLLYYGIVNCGQTPPEDIFAKFEHALFQGVAIGQNQLYELSNIFSAFEKNGIKYLPLKGSVIKALYPKPEMRVMGDADILITEHNDEIIEEIMHSLGFSFYKQNEKVDSWSKGKTVMIEIHKSLFSSENTDFNSYYADVWKKAIPINESHTHFELSDEDTFIYLFAHFVKHFRNAGIGIRHITDLFVFSKVKPNLNCNYIENEMKKLKLYDFYSNVMRTVKVWFYGGKPDEITDFITEKIITSGSFGTHEDYITTSFLKKIENYDISHEKVRHTMLLNMLFPPYSGMCKRYPVLKRAPYLLPIMWIFRFFETIIKKPQKINYQKHNIDLSSKERLEERKKELEAVGLKFDFKE